MKKLVVTTEGCGACAQLKKQLAPEIQRGEVVTKDIQEIPESSDVWSLVNRFKLHHVPLVFEITEQGDGQKQVCVKDHTEKQHCALLKQFQVD